MMKEQLNSLRRFEPTDAAAVIQLLNAGGQPYGLKRAVVAGAGQVRLNRYVPPSSQKVVAVDQQNHVVGYAYLADREQRIVYETGGGVQPAYQGLGIGDRMIAWAEAGAQRLSEGAPAGVKTVLQTNLFEFETAAQALFTSHGFTRVREWLHLAIELGQEPAQLALPAGLRLRALDLENDWELLGPAMDEAYADHWGTITESFPETENDDEAAGDEAFVEDESYSNAPGYCFVVVDERTGAAAGGILCNGRLVERADTGRIGSVFVRPAYRRSGVGRALMLAAFQAFWQNGSRRLILDTDADSFTVAPRFYTSLGMQPYRREYLYEKEIRPGREVRRLAL